MVQRFRVSLETRGRFACRVSSLVRMSHGSFRQSRRGQAGCGPSSTTWRRFAERVHDATFTSSMAVENGNRHISSRRTCDASTAARDAACMRPHASMTRMTSRSPRCGTRFPTWLTRHAGTKPTSSRTSSPGSTPWEIPTSRRSSHIVLVFPPSRSVDGCLTSSATNSESTPSPTTSLRTRTSIRISA